MAWYDPDLLTNLRKALDRFAWDEVATLCGQIVERVKAESTTIDEELAKDLLYCLRRKRQFALMVKLAEAIFRSGLNTPLIRRDYAQALIDQGAYFPAEMVLQTIVKDVSESNVANREAHGLLGRIYKQVYVNNKDATSPANRANLERAIREYLSVYQCKPQEYWWHGINAVACLARAGRDGFPLAGLPVARDLASEILAAIKTTEENMAEPALPVWQVATKVEAYVALGDEENAARTARQYVESNADAFEIASTLRQFEEVWQLKETEPPGRLLLPVLRTAHLKKTGAMMQRESKNLRAEAEALEQNMDRLESILGSDKMQTLTWYKLGLEQCNSVARIEHRRTQQGVGTGWLVRASDFFPGEQGVLLLTNDHVISKPRHTTSICPEDCQVNFQSTNEVLEVEENIHWFSVYSEFDATFLKLKKEPQAQPLALHKSAMQVTDPPPRMYIIGHPQGRDLELSLQDNYLLRSDDKFLHYRTPTEAGSSGSPVFEPIAWEVVALHHKGNTLINLGGGKPGQFANEGISILRLQAETKKPRSV